MSRPPNKLFTLVFIIDDNRVLLGYKKRGFAKDWWNGFGGKVHPGESVEDGAKRELLEESSMTANTLDKVGVLIFEFKGEDQLLEVHVFRSFDYSGTPTESEEMRPQWFNNNEIPFDNMWPDDHLWYPLMLTGRYFDGYLLFEGMNKLLDHKFTMKQY